MDSTTAAPGILMWRSLLSFMGGLGVIALGLFLLPFLNIGGVTYFKIESSDIEDRPFERLPDVHDQPDRRLHRARRALRLLLRGPACRRFHAINHAMSTVATGGLSTHDTSFVRYADNPGDPVDRHGLHVHRRPALFDHDPVRVRGRFDVRDPQIRVFAGYSFVLLGRRGAIYILRCQDEHSVSVSR
jgi:trk system potassium uptake protein TrkH